jgi:hypothetical protein
MARTSSVPSVDGDSDGADLASLRRSGGQRATITDVARLAGVSAMTVSRVLNEGSCSAKARDAVRRSIALLGYEPNSAARALASSRQGARSRPETLPSQAGMPEAWTTYSRMMLRLLQPAD